MNASIKKAIQDFYAAHKAAIDDFASYMGVPPLWPVCVFHNESGLQVSARNSINAVGLNQMLPSTLAGLQVTVDAYQNGTVEFQLSIMKKFFAPIKGRVKRAGDFYLFNFLPAAVIENVGADYVLGESGSTDKFKGISKAKIYDQNKSLDYNHDGKITRRDFWNGFEVKYDELVTGNFFFQGPSNRLQN